MLPKLRHVAFSDPVYGGKSPVASMANYHVHILYHLPQLEYIDGLHITTRQVAEQAEVISSNSMKMRVYHRNQPILGHGDQEEDVVSYETKDIRT